MKNEISHFRKTIGGICDKREIFPAQVDRMSMRNLKISQSINRRKETYKLFLIKNYSYTLGDKIY